MPELNVRGIILSLSWPLVGSLGAVELADLAGDWTLGELDAPTRLREIYYNDLSMTSRTSENSQDFAKENEFITFAYYPDPLLTGIRNFSVSPTGTVSGSENGQILSISGSRIFYTDGEELSTVFSNTAADILLTSSRNVDRQGQTLCLKRPGSLATSELAGDWFLVSMINPADISTNVFEGRLVDTYFAAESRVVSGDIRILANGFFNGLFSGTISATGPGAATVSTGGDSIPFKFNASKNLGIATPDNEDEQEIVVLVRKPDSLATADLAGTWRISAIQLPTSLTETYYNVETMGSRQLDSSEVAGTNEVLVDVFHKDRFELNRLQILVDDSGTFTGSVNGSLVAAGDSVSVTVEGDNVTLHPNADKTFMVGINTFEDSHELIYCVKTSEGRAADFEEEADLKLIRAESALIFSWNSGENLVLQEAGSLTGWSTVEEANGTDAYAVDPSEGGSRFFRLAEQP